MLVTIHQPSSCPGSDTLTRWTRRICSSGSTPYSTKKNEWQNRNGLKIAQGPQWLTVPVRFRFPARIDEVVVNDDAPWRHKHKQALVTNYRRAQAWEAEEASLDALYAETGTLLRDINGVTIDWLSSRLRIDTENRWASDLPITEQEPTQRLVEICRHVGASA